MSMVGMVKMVIDVKLYTLTYLINEQPCLLFFEFLPPLLVFFYVVKAFFSCTKQKKSALNTRLFYPARLLDSREYVLELYSAKFFVA